MGNFLCKFFISFLVMILILKLAGDSALEAPYTDPDPWRGVAILIMSAIVVIIFLFGSLIGYLALRTPVGRE